MGLGGMEKEGIGDHFETVFGNVREMDAYLLRIASDFGDALLLRFPLFL